MRRIYQQQYQRNRTFAHIGHDCEMPAEPDVILEFYPGNGWRDRLKRNWLRKIVVSEKLSQHLHQSHGYLKKERRRHLIEHPRVIHPYSIFRISWEIFIFIVDLIQLSLVPLDVAYCCYVNTFKNINSDVWAMVRLCLDFAYCVDVFMTFNTGYYDILTKEVKLDYRSITKRYAKTMLIIDLITALPSHWEIFDPTIRNNLPLFFSLNGLTFLKIFRFVNLDRNFRNICNIFNLGYYFYQYTSLTSQVLYFWHAISSIMALFIPFGAYMQGNYESLLEFDEHHGFRALQIIAFNYYSGALVMTTTSRGTVTVSSSSLEYLTVLTLWLISRLGQMILMARITELIKAKKSSNIQYKKKMEQLIEFMRYKKLPLFTQKRLLRYYIYHYQQNYFNEDEIFITISGQLRQEIAMHSCRKLVENVEFFSDMPFNLLVRVVSCLRTETYMEHDLICKANSVGDCMYFIASGTVAVYTGSGKEICHLEDGDHFGEVALVSDDTLRVANVVAIEITEVYRLDRVDFIRAIYPYPDLMENIQKIASQRKEETLFLDEHNRRRVAMRR